MSHGPPDDAGFGVRDAAADASCTDLDGDGAGVGDGCQASDCDDADPFLTGECGDDELCRAGVHVTGCQCSGQSPVPCYTGPAETAGRGECRPGLRECVGGRYGPCEGQALPQPELCDDHDEDCDGVVDDGVQSECGDCNFECAVESVGVGGDHPFDPGAPGAEGVAISPDGSLTLGDRVVVANRVIWIPNSSEGTISKVDTTTHEERGRYRTDGVGYSDPSRTTVNLHGDVISANRWTGSATFVMAGDCPDQDRDGIVETSQGPQDVLPWGEDECVVWSIAVSRRDLRGSAIEERDRKSTRLNSSHNSESRMPSSA
jgi:hypothetical protein